MWKQTSQSCLQRLAVVASLTYTLMTVAMAVTGPLGPGYSIRTAYQAMIGTFSDLVDRERDRPDQVRHRLGYAHAEIWSWRIRATERMSSSPNLMAVQPMVSPGPSSVCIAPRHHEFPPQLLGSRKSLLCGLPAGPAPEAENLLLQCLSRTRGGARDFEDQMGTRWFVWDLSLAGPPQSQNKDSEQPPFPALLVLCVSGEFIGLLCFTRMLLDLLPIRGQIRLLRAVKIQKYDLCELAPIYSGTK